jgi:limonene-1,2-epoxide hydrolase
MPQPHIYPPPRAAALPPSGVEIVESFLAAGCAFELDRAFTYLADDVEYQNVPFPPIRGRRNVERQLRRFARYADVFDVRMHHIVEQDGVVLTERTDIIRGPLLDLRFWVCGTFVIRNGRIAVWRDRFDLAQLSSQVLTSPIRKLVRRAKLVRR